MNQTENEKLKEIFKLMNRVEEDIPPSLKDEVMATIRLSHLTTNIGSLFTDKYIHSFSDLTCTIIQSEDKTNSQ